MPIASKYRPMVRNGLRQVVECDSRRREAAILEVVHRTIQDCPRTLRRDQQQEEPDHFRRSRQTSVLSLRAYNRPPAIAG
jgi:hypothetical protein